MLKETVKEAATIEEAVAACALELGVKPDELKTEVLQQPQKKTLGLFGGSSAKVRGYVEVTAADAGLAYLKKILDVMGIGDTEITKKDTDKGCEFQLSGEHLGFIIGHRGDTLDALQYLVSLAANRMGGDYYRITLDIGNFREKREGTLQNLAAKIGRQAAKTGKRTSLEAMNPYERRIIHTVVQGIDGATSWSVGVEPNRHVVVGPSEDNTAWKRNRRPRNPEHSDRPDSRNRGPRTNHKEPHEITPAPHQIREFIPRSNPLPVADGATPPVKTSSDKESTATLYGRIDL